MAEVVHVLDVTVSVDGQRYTAQVVGRQRRHLWEGWIEFVSGDGESLRTPRETTQSDRDALAYWATGLSSTYLEGALQRALASPKTARRRPASSPQFATPAPSPGDPVAIDQAVLDPFSLAQEGESRLRNELGALRAWRLRDIARAYRLTAGDVDLESLRETELIDRIVAGVRDAQART